MGLPPNEVLLAPPRRSIDPLEWSKRSEIRPCLQDLPQSNASVAPSRALSPLRSERRYSASHVPLCVIPKIPDRSENIHAQASKAPVPVSTKAMRSLAVAKAEEQKSARLLPMRRRATREGAVPPPPDPAAIHVSTKRDTARRYSIDVQTTTTAPSLPQRPHSAGPRSPELKPSPPRPDGGQ